MSSEIQNNEAEKTRQSIASRLAQVDGGEDAPEQDPLESIGESDTYVSPATAEGFQSVFSPISDDEGSKPKRRRKLWIIPLVLVALLVAGYVGGAVYFNDHCLPNTTVDGDDVSGKTKSEIAASIQAQLDGYTLSVSGDGVELSLKGSDLGLAYDGEAYATEVMSRANAWEWPLIISKTRAYELQKTVKYDSEKVASALAPFVESSKASAEESRKNASITYDAATASYTLKDGGDTRTLDADLAAKKICSAIDSLQSSVALGDECLDAGDDYSKSVAEANAYLAAAPELTLAGKAVCQVSAEQVASWLKIGDDLSVEVDSSAVTTWCKGELSKACDTVGTERTYTRPDGKSVTVSGGTYGWNINGAETAEKIVDALKAGQKTTIEIPTYSQGETYANGGADWGNRYIDVDLTEQYARMYDASGNLIWETEIVTGDATKGYNTPCGVYTMNSNRASNNVELRGKTDATTGEPEYISYVDYWMPFIDNSYALHDASWRSRFGGTIYEGNGSHGCVNLPVDKAAELFNLCSVGDVVVVHN